MSHYTPPNDASLPDDAIQSSYFKSTSETKFIYKVYNLSLTQWDVDKWDSAVWDFSSPLYDLIAVWSEDVISDPSFTRIVNGGDGEMGVRLARPYDNFGGGYDVSLGNRVDVYAIKSEQDPTVAVGLDTSYTNQLLYRGYISAYLPTLDGDDEYIDVRITGYGVTLSHRILQDGDGNTKITYTNQDIGAIFRDVLYKFQTHDDGELFVDDTLIENTGTSVSYVFNTNTYREALDTLIGLAPDGYYWNILPSGSVVFKQRSSNATHTFSTKRHLSRLVPELNLDDYYSEAFYVGADTGGGDNLYYKASRIASSDVYGKRVQRVTDGRVTDADTARAYLSSFLDAKSTPNRRTGLQVISLSGRARERISGSRLTSVLKDSRIGYDIESISVGDTIQVNQITKSIPENTLWGIADWDEDFWDEQTVSNPDDVMQIFSLTYTPDFVTLEARARLPEISRRVEEINEQFKSTVFSKNPTAPSV